MTSHTHTVVHGRKTVQLLLWMHGFRVSVARNSASTPRGAAVSRPPPQPRAAEAQRRIVARRLARGAGRCRAAQPGAAGQSGRQLGAGRKLIGQHFGCRHAHARTGHVPGEDAESTIGDDQCVSHGSLQRRFALTTRDARRLTSRRHSISCQRPVEETPSRSDSSHRHRRRDSPSVSPAASAEPVTYTLDPNHTDSWPPGSFGFSRPSAMSIMSPVRSI